MRFHVPAQITNLFLTAFQNLSLFYQPKQKYCIYIFNKSGDILFDQKMQ